MKSIFGIVVVLSALLTLPQAAAQKVCRTEFTPYETRAAAIDGDHSMTQYHLRYTPQPMGAAESGEAVGSKVDMPAAWRDYDVYIHLENTVKAYDLVINGNIAATIEDGYTPHDIFISPFIKQGSNEVVLRLRASRYHSLNAASKPTMREQFTACYIYAQHRLSVFDYDIRIDEDTATASAHLSLDIVLRNNFNYEEPMTVGYDIYSPSGKLLDYSVLDRVVAGRSLDTLRIRRNLGQSAGAWSRRNPALYRLTIYTKRNGKPQEYIPLRCGVGRATYADGKIVVAGSALDVHAKEYNALEGREAARKEILALRKQGYNVLMPSQPQPLWFYDICDELGIYVIEQAAINPTAESENRRIGGTPSNDPRMAEQYVERVREMYYRTRNRQCIIAYSLGGNKAGNGYAMYKAYEWLRSIEPQRAILCRTAAGEWNSDIDWKETTK